MTSIESKKKAKPKMVDREKSEFGSGLAICLVKFAEHFENRYAIQIYNVHAMRGHLDDSEYLRRYGRETEQNVLTFNQFEGRQGYEQGLSHIIELWANGATDHLYDLQVPQKWKRTQFGRKVEALRNKGLEIGHGFTGKVYTFEDFAELQKMTRELALLLDVGLWAMMNEKTKLDEGQW